MTFDLARVRLDNALLLFDEFVQQAARHADAAALRGLEGRFAEMLAIQPSYWSQLKSRSRQIGEKLARQFERRMRKPYGWMDVAHLPGEAAPTGVGLAPQGALASGSSEPQGDDERFIVGLVLTYSRRHPDKARARLLDLLGEVLRAEPGAEPARRAEAVSDGEATLWQRSQAGVQPLKRRR
jgi:hypothetical protein